MDLTLIIPAKEEKFSLPLVLEEIREFSAKKLVILSKNDDTTYNAILYDQESLVSLFI